MTLRHLFIVIYIIFFWYSPGNKFALAQKQSDPFVYGDLLPDAPALSSRGKYAVGVRTMTFTHKNQLDVIGSEGGKIKTYDRIIKVEIWYPVKNDGKKAFIEYEDVLGIANDPKRPVKTFTFSGRASRDAQPEISEGPYPLIIISHGYLGSRLLFTYLTENLASKGYVVVSIDHPESTFLDPGKFPSTLLNRPLDDLFILNEVAGLGKKGGKSFLSGLVDAENTALIGYSMGGYGVLNVAGAGFTPLGAQLFGKMTGESDALFSRTTGSAEYQASMDPRIKAIVAFAPWGMEHSMWDAEGLAGLKVPTFFVAGSQDDISGYEKGVKAIYDSAINTERYLLTYINARHNVAPNPPPIESYEPGLDLDEYLRYAEPAWDERRINNINQHFVTAFLGIHLKNLDYHQYLELNQNSNDTTWTGFKPRTSVGLEFRHGKPK